MADNLEFRTFQRFITFVNFMNLNAEGITNTFTTKRFGCLLYFVRSTVFIIPYDSRLIFDNLTVNRIIVNNCFIFNCKVIVSRNVP